MCIRTKNILDNYTAKHSVLNILVALSIIPRMNAHVRQFYELVVGMTEKELHARYKNTFFGFLWLIINPLLQMLVIGFIFPFFIKNTIEQYYFYLFAGLLLWNFFSLSLNKTTPSIVNERALITKAAFPRSIIPLSIVISNFIHYLVAMSIFLIPVIFTQHLAPAKFGLFISSIALLLLFTMGMSLLTSALNVKYRDVSFFVQAGLMVWFYTTPIVYSLNQIPAHYVWLWQLNPLTSIVQLMQAAITSSPPPLPDMLWINAIEIIVILIAGMYVFKKESVNFDDWL